MFDIVLYQPEIPPNTGNIIRLTANTGCRLHLLRPLGFDLEEKQLRRAGLDYHDMSAVHVHEHWDEYFGRHRPERVFAFSTKGREVHTAPAYREGDCLLFGPESRGLPAELLASPQVTRLLRLPMRPDNRSLNLSNTVAVVVYEAWRQQGFVGGI